MYNALHPTVKRSQWHFMGKKLAFSSTFKHEIWIFETAFPFYLHSSFLLLPNGTANKLKRKSVITHIVIPEEEEEANNKKKLWFDLVFQLKCFLHFGIKDKKHETDFVAVDTINVIQ